MKDFKGFFFFLLFYQFIKPISTYKCRLAKKDQEKNAILVYKAFYLIFILFIFLHFSLRLF